MFLNQLSQLFYNERSTIFSISNNFSLYDGYIYAGSTYWSTFFSREMTFRPKGSMRLGSNREFWNGIDHDRTQN